MNRSMWMRKAAVLSLSVGLAGLALQLHAQYRGDHHDDHHDSHYDSHNSGYDHRPDYHFRGDDDRGRFGRYYRNDANRWRNNRNRPHFQAGGVIPRSYVIRPVPSSYYRGVPPPPPGYNFGYYDGYVVAYNPTTRIIADVLDLATGNY